MQIVKLAGEHELEAIHFNKEGDYYIIASNLDRLYTSIEAWRFVTLDVKCYTVGSVAKSVEVSGSDHVGVAGVLPVRIEYTSFSLA